MIHRPQISSRKYSERYHRDDYENRAGARSPTIPSRRISSRRPERTQWDWQLSMSDWSSIPTPWHYTAAVMTMVLSMQVQREWGLYVRDDAAPDLAILSRRSDIAAPDGES